MDSDFLLTKARFTGNSESGAVRLDGAHVGGQLNATAMHIDNSTGPALDADGLQVDGDMFLTNGRFTGNSELGTVRLLGAHIGGQLVAGATHIDNSAGPALNGNSMQVDDDMLLTNSRFTGNSELGTVRLLSAHIGDQLNVAATHVDNSAGPALNADGLQVDGDMLLTNGRFTGNSELGTVRLLSAHIGDHLIASAMHINNSAGPALNADRLQVEASLHLTTGRFTGNSELGTVRLLGAHIGGQLVAGAMHINNSAGPALDAEYLQVEAGAYLTDAQFVGSGRHEAVSLHSVRIGGQLAFAGTRIFNGSELGIALEDAKVAGTVFLPTKLVCPQPWGRSCPCSRRICLDGFKFNDLAANDWREWLHLIRFHTAYYSPSPYQQLAASERAAGHDGNARHILIAQQQDLHRLAPEALGGRLTRSFHRLWGLLGGYGYRARRTAAALLFTLAAAGCLGLWAGHVETNRGYAAERTTASGSPGQQCTPVELIGLGLDRGLPFAPTGLRTRCDLDTATVSGQVFTVSVWIIQAAIWGLATLALAGYTGLVRKPA
ncbi:hypothetical protein ABTX61_32990 [Amycolatopsis japonica]|uniref:hypothetical protein n=1 Tax=Amycolatopsis japonica TaxID=208439 RepID=UPI00331F7220